MKQILVATHNQEACSVIKGCFRPAYQVDETSDRTACYEMAQKKRYEFIFIDILFLQETVNGKDYPDYGRGLQPLWNAFPAVEIIVLSSQDLIREVVNAVKAGASNYLTYPINPAEVKYIIESIYESLRMQSELDYLRDAFWHSDSLEMVRTKSPVMKRVFD
ncbi:MAG: response regulator, partial [bacterium]